jgi:hypothetical protein
MSTLINILTDMEQIPGESFLLSSLQENVVFSVGGKVLKKGRLLLFKKTHYFIHFCLLTEKNTRENLEIPFPFNVEDYSDEGLMYFDYRLSSLRVKALPDIPDKLNSPFLDKILEITRQ